MTDQRPRKAYAALGIGIFSLGMSAILVSVADAPGTITAFYRLAIAALLVALPALRRIRSSEAPVQSKGLRLALIGGVFFGLDMLLWTSGIMLSGPTRPTLLANTAPLWVGVGSLLIFGERHDGTFWLGLAIAMIGATMVVGVDMTLGSGLGLGSLLGLLAGVFYGAYQLVTQTGRGHLSALAYFWISTLSAAILLLLVNLLFGRAFSGYTVGTYVIFLVTGILVQLCGWLVVNYAQGYLPASVVAPTLLAQPVATLVLAAILLGETFSVWHLFGGAAVLAGVYLVHRSQTIAAPLS